VPLSRTTRLLLALWALGLAAAAIFPASYPEAPDPVSGEIHLYACLVAFCSLPGAAISLLEPLKGRPERVALVRAIRLSAGAFALFALSFVFVRLTEAGVEPFPEVSAAFPIGVMQRLLLLADVVLLGTLLWDVIGQRRLVPWWSWIALLTLYGSVFVVPDDSARGLIRLGFVAVSTAYVLFWPVRDRGDRRSRGRGRPRRPTTPPAQRSRDATRGEPEATLG